MRLIRSGVPMMLLCLLLAGCGGAGLENSAEQRALDIRGDYLSMEAMTAHAAVTADYGQRVYAYELDVAWAREGETVLTVTAPENIAGVTARLADGETALEFDGVRLETGPLDEAGMSPIDAIPALLAAAREGFIAECGTEVLGEAEALRLCCRNPDSAAGTGTEITLWLDPDTGALIQGELASDGFTVLRCVFSEVQMALPPQ